MSCSGKPKGDYRYRSRGRNVARIIGGLMKTDVQIVVMAKFPEPGRVKTRLSVPPSPLNPVHACDLHRLFLLEIGTRLVGQGKPVAIAHDPPGDDVADRFTQMFSEVGKRLSHLFPQVPGDLGARLAGVAGAARGVAESILFFGADSPDLPAAHASRAITLCGGHDVTLGPTFDGGYWCLGVSARVDMQILLDEIDWSSGREFDQTLSRARSLGYNVGLADRWDDVDRPDDLRRLLERLRRSTEADDQALLMKLQKILPEEVLR